MRLEDLNYFLAIAQERNVGRAALLLGVSQPALSKSLQRLEGELGFRLFERGRKGMEMTPAAQAFHARINAMRGHLSDAIREASDIHLGALGVLRVGISPLYIDPIFSPAAALLREQRPAVRIQLAIDLNDGLLAGLRAGDLDLALCNIEASQAGDLHQEKLFRDDLRVIVRAGHPLTRKSGALTLADLVGHPWILPRTGVSARRQVEARFAEKGLPAPEVAVEVGSTVTQLVGLVGRSDLVSVMGERMITAQGASAATVLDVRDGRWIRQIGLVTRRAGQRSPLASRFMEIVREVIAAEKAPPARARSARR